MRFHVVSLPHTTTTREYEWCAYTSKVRKFCNMMTDLGHDVFLYSGPANDARCKFHFNCVSGDLPENGYIPDFDPSNRMFRDFNGTAVGYIRSIIQPRDFICLIGGMAQEYIARSFADHIVVEFGIGYGGIIPDAYHVFESYAWMHTVLGARSNGDAHSIDGRFFDTVIPNYFDAKDFQMGGHDRQYLLYFGRLIERKGVGIAIDVADHLGLPLHVCGTGDYPLPNWVTYHGVVGPEQRSMIMGNAIALLAPTLYIEPFGGVTIEANFCGTPSITTDFGAFTETIDPKWRCNSLHCFIEAVEMAMNLSINERIELRHNSIDHYSLEPIGNRYEKYFTHLSTLFSDGFYHMPSITDENISSLP